MMPSKALQMQ
jgi:hypothetical protein